MLDSNLFLNNDTLSKEIKKIKGWRYIKPHVLCVGVSMLTS